MEIKDMMQNFPGPGKVEVILLRPERLKPVLRVAEVYAIKNQGLEGDRYKITGGSRQVTLIQSEHLQAVASYLGQEILNPDATRRNIVVQGINLLALKGKRFRIGEATLEYSGECHPCSRMEETLGRGGYNAMRGHGGITARIIEGGIIQVGDKVTVVPSQ